MEPTFVLDRIDAGYFADQDKRKARAYIGASGIGSPCDAYLAYSLRGFPDTPPEPRLARIFQLGHRIETLVVADLKRKAQMTVWDRDPETGQQWTYELLGGHIKTHMDGQIALDDRDGAEVLILEVKSMNKASWNKFVKHGIQKSHPGYYEQLQMMMGMSGFRRAYFIAYCKNDSSYHDEIVEFDQLVWSEQCSRIERALNGDAEKVAASVDDWRCRSCFKRDACWASAGVEARCMTCAHACPTERGGWHCARFDQPAPGEACSAWRVYKAKER